MVYQDCVADRRGKIPTHARITENGSTRLFKIKDYIYHIHYQDRRRERDVERRQLTKSYLDRKLARIHYPRTPTLVRCITSSIQLHDSATPAKFHKITLGDKVQPLVIRLPPRGSIPTFQVDDSRLAFHCQLLVASSKKKVWRSKGSTLVFNVLRMETPT